MVTSLIYSHTGVETRLDGYWPGSSAFYKVGRCGMRKISDTRDTGNLGASQV
jgi:hypothetical protein